ncbi:MAG: 2,3-bisphosphoglycerate-independent phosphoglycerate mutase [Candidatus Gottesmanbacteria bacterium GW2011_GWC2_39_8]|uniref:2,3-bisphosphoglycerate-independent phosphoglycerate mutase n=1 Tax=Candidatus Gottesmanbacteria bacterium GW2011_GWC2_39_8 TaxID=1618450 RepID=A0A0G0PT43_9BACT|nr:MAG: 2,3-bisphosphoglycerate-independent phosphoglycerate mutase [Candidatus Gottesmanbacteria bacterium GW2011_GWC2_39_8]
MKSVILIILDGWGIAPSGAGNATSLAHIPQFHTFFTNYPHGLLRASGQAVGLPKNEVGNTETGHLNLGAGRIVYQDLPKINMAIADGSFFASKAFLGAIEHARKNASKLHLIGLIGAGGVHSNLEHLFALMQLCKEQNFKEVFLHLITDGRDSPPTSGASYVSEIIAETKSLGVGRIATIMGRFFAMDRDKRWDRTEKAYKALTEGVGNHFTDPVEIVNESYKSGKTDEFIEPGILMEQDKPVATVSAGDSVIFFNFRVDRPRQLTKAFVLDDFAGHGNEGYFDPYAVKYYKKHILEDTNASPPFLRGTKISDLFFTTMTEYEKGLSVSAVAFPPVIVDYPLGRAIADHGIRQLRMCESEKERFVTYYFNGQKEETFPLEERKIIPSPKVPTYDLKPEMSALPITDELIARIRSENYGLIVVNFANADMVGHTGVISAAVKACEVLDLCLGKIVSEALNHNGVCLITADHGNVEEMIDPRTGGVDTEHSSYPVPFIAIGREFEGKSKDLGVGMLADIAPTILGLLRLTKPSTMTGRNLLDGLTED